MLKTVNIIMITTIYNEYCLINTFEMYQNSGDNTISTQYQLCHHPSLVYHGYW